MSDTAMSKEWQPGVRCGFTVIQNKPGGNNLTESRYDADRLECVFRDGDMEPMLSFVSSGRRIILPAKEVVAVEFSPIKVITTIVDGGLIYSGLNFCAGCDQGFTHIIKRPA